jgi:PAS domain S-box-containing protein
MGPVLIVALVVGWGVAAVLGAVLVLRVRARRQPDGTRPVADRGPQVRDALDRAGAEFYLAAADGSLVYANRAAASSLGYTVEELRAMGLPGIDPAYGKRFAEHVAALPHGGVQCFETVHLAKDGSRITKEMRAVYLRIGEQDYVCSVGHDVSARRRAEEQHRGIEGRARQAERLESLAALAGGVAHDFSSVLTAVLGNLEMALDELPGDSSARPCIAEATAAGRRAVNLTRQLLSFSGRGCPRLASVDVGHLLEAATPRLCALVPGNVSVRVDAAPGLPSVMADAGQLQQALVDLVTNARDAIGARPGVITVSAARRTLEAGDLDACIAARPLTPGEFVVVAVADSGCGMSAEALDHAFDPFFSRKQGGRGLGLPMVAGIAKGFHGGVLLESAVGQGTTVTLLIPVPVQVSAAPAAVEALRPPPGPASRPRGVMLVVDDEESVRALTSRMAARMGFEVLAAEDGVQAVEVFAQHADQVSCVVLDLLMPRMDGFAAFAALRKTRPEVRVVLCSGFSEPERAQALITTGARGVLPKPFSYAQFQDAIERAMGDQAAPS